MGFTQPYTAFPVIEDASNNAKGFTSRILWYFPKPVFATLRESILTESECETVTAFKDTLGKSFFVFCTLISSINTAHLNFQVFSITFLNTWVKLWL